MDGTLASTIPANTPRAAHPLEAQLFRPGCTSRLLVRRAEAYVPPRGDMRRLSVQL